MRNGTLTLGRLNGCSFDEALLLRNRGFEQYFNDMTTTMTGLLHHLGKYAIQPELSVVAYLDGKLAGFVFLAVKHVGNRKLAWNGGTGVFPEFRGKGIAKAMMLEVERILIEQKVDLALLEVIVQNKNAIAAYEKGGFQIVVGGLSPQGDQISFVWVIPSTVENPEEIIKFLDWAWSDEADYFFNFGIEGVNYTLDNGEVQWDPEAEANTDKGATVFYQLSLNPRGDGRMHPNIVDVHPQAEKLSKAIEVAEANAVPNDGLYMPALESLQTRPELMPGTGAGTLFLDVFAKIITGQEEMDAFDDFVAEWKRRGGDEAIQEATAWYHNFHN